VGGVSVSPGASRERATAAREEESKREEESGRTRRTRAGAATHTVLTLDQGMFGVETLGRIRLQDLDWR